MTTEVFFSTKEEIAKFFLACLLGLFLGAVYDLFRVLRRIIPHNNFLVFVEDFLYMLFSSLCFFIFSMELVRGALRLYVFAGVCAGFFLFHYTAGNVLVFLVKKLWFCLEKFIILPIFKLTLQPFLMGFRKIAMKTKALFVQKCKRLKKTEKSRKKHLKVDN